MDMTKLKVDVEALAKQELERGTKFHGPHTSIHQAYAVLKEELEEAEDEKEKLDFYLKILWDTIKADGFECMPSELNNIKDHLLSQIAESIQALAMVYKFQDYLEEMGCSFAKDVE